MENLTLKLLTNEPNKKFVITTLNITEPIVVDTYKAEFKCTTKIPNVRLIVHLRSLFENSYALIFKHVL